MKDVVRNSEAALKWAMAIAIFVMAALMGVITVSVLSKWPLGF